MEWCNVEHSIQGAILYTHTKCTHPRAYEQLWHYKLTRHSTGLPSSTLPDEEKRAALSMVGN